MMRAVSVDETTYRVEYIGVDSNSELSQEANPDFYNREMTQSNLLLHTRLPASSYNIEGSRRSQQQVLFSTKYPRKYYLVGQNFP